MQNEPVAVVLIDGNGRGSTGSSAVDDRDCRARFAFTGKIDTVTTALDPPKPTRNDVKQPDTTNRAARDNN